MTTHLLGAPATVVAALDAAGLRVVTDPRNVNPPCVWVELVNSQRLSRCKVAATVTAAIMVPGPANGDALKALDGIAAIALAALDAAGLPWTDTTLTTTGSPATGEPLPTWLITVPTTTEV